MEEQDSNSTALPCDRRYRTSRYFLEDQLRCSDAVSDFRSIKDMVSRTQAFNVRGSFRFQQQVVPVHIEVKS
jgi:hypothetical protein